MTASTGTTVTLLVAALVMVGLVMIAVAVWLVRATRTDPRALGPLEVMGGRRWRNGDADRRRTNLDTARPPGAPPPSPMVAFEVIDDDAAAAANCEPSMQESALSAHTSEDEPAGTEPAGTDGGSEVEARTE
jgi:hypothetical protein